MAPHHVMRVQLFASSTFPCSYRRLRSVARDAYEYLYWQIKWNVFPYTFQIMILTAELNTAFSAFDNSRPTEMRPFIMGIVVSVVVGVVLTLPISSAALCAMIGISGLAGGAATAGCCAQMIGFAVISFRENGWGGLVAQGLGTSMLQMGNICKKPAIWIAPTLAAAVTGPVATLIFKLESAAILVPISSRPRFRLHRLP